jgi:maltooligosyltrehalose trehalohydrolase
MKNFHSMPFGATVLADDAGVLFQLWAPSVARIELALADNAAAGGPQTAQRVMARGADGWHRLSVSEARAGDRYRFVLPDGLRVPDPASRRNPDDVHEASEVVDPQAYQWNDGAWTGRPWTEAVIYELHVGAFTPEGTFAAAQRRLPELAALGITAIELLPVADFPGKRGWGYDGVLLFAPDAVYGTPDELKAFVDAAHALGLMVLMDVVYNHFGPEGNYLHAGTPEFFNPAHQTPWGAAINYDGTDSAMVRDFFVHNALYWGEEFHCDGLRMDAVHAIRDDSTIDIVTSICSALRDGPGRERHVHVVLENDANGSHYLERDPATQAPLIATAQWNDDLHHAAHVVVTGETDGYYADYADDAVGNFGLALAEGFVFQGQASPFRNGETRGEPSAQLPLESFVSFLQTHDQVGNRAFGDRISSLADPVLLRAAYACLLLSPHTPMLFMGEEYGASTPFLYFCDFGPELAAAVSEGRRSEFGGFAAFADESKLAEIPDPNAESTFTASKLKWEERGEGMHAELLAHIRGLLTLRRTLLVPRLEGQHAGGRHWRDGEALRVEWLVGGADGTPGGARLQLLAHFGKTPAESIMPLEGETLYSIGVETREASDDSPWRLQPGAVHVTLQENPLV